MIVSVRQIDDEAMLALLGGGPSIVVGGGERLLEALQRYQAPIWVVSADPGSPLFGPPAAVTLAAGSNGTLQLKKLAAVGTLDAARYRLAIVAEVAALASQVPKGRPLVVAAPAITRGIAAVELVPGVVRTVAARTVVVAAKRAAAGTAAAARAAGADVVGWTDGGDAPSPRDRVDRRSALWAGWMQASEVREVDLETTTVVGAPPPRSAPEAWTGRLVGLLASDGHTVALGRIEVFEKRTLRVRAAGLSSFGAPASVLVRDAAVAPDGTVGSAPRVTPQPNQPQRGPEVAVQLPRPEPGVHALLEGTLVGGLLGDPLVVLEHAGHRSVTLLDLGEHVGLPVRLAHRVHLVLLSHTHMDHFAGIHWLLRRRLGVDRELLLVGPVATAQRVAAAVDAFTWDRIGDSGPCLRVVEVADDGRLTTFRQRVGRDRGPIDGSTAAASADGLVQDDGSVRVLARVLDHGGTPVLAYRIEEHNAMAVSSEALRGTGLPDGPWVGELKACAMERRNDALIELPDGTRASVRQLAATLLEHRRGQVLVYATDVADTPDNRERLITLASGADLLLCEAAFAEADREHASATGHLTARACGEIAAAAGVARLLPFHLSNRYQHVVDTVLDEVRAAFPRIVAPRIR